MGIVKMEYFRCLQVIIAAFTVGIGGANATNLFVEENKVLSSNGSRASVVIQYQSSRGMLGRKLDLNLKTNNGIYDTLSYYYGAARKNDLNTIEKLMFVGDGSKDKYLGDIVKNPTAFSKFDQIKSIEIGKIYAHGNYFDVDLLFEKLSGEKFYWQAMLYCENRCFISEIWLADRMEKLDRLHSIVKNDDLALISSNKLSGFKSFVVSDYKGNTNNPLIINMDYFKEEEFNEKFDIRHASGRLKKKVPYYLKPILQLLAVSVDVRSEYLRFKSASLHAEMKKLTDEVFNEIWSGYQYYKSFSSFYKKDGEGLVYARKNFRSLMATLITVRKITFLGRIIGKEVDLVHAEIEVDSSEKIDYFFMVGKTGIQDGKLLYPERVENGVGMLLNDKDAFAAIKGK